jgi:hypothetical protein
MTRAVHVCSSVFEVVCTCSGAPPWITLSDRLTHKTGPDRGADASVAFDSGSDIGPDPREHSVPVPGLRDAVAAGVQPLAAPDRGHRSPIPPLPQQDWTVNQQANLHGHRTEPKRSPKAYDNPRFE